MDNLCKILIVDDEYLLRQGIKHSINWQKEGFEIVGEASNGKEALEMIAALKPHIIISDIVMPLLDGVNLAKVVKENFPDIQIVILSGYSDFEYVKETFKVGVKDYILKPKLNPEEVLSLLKNMANTIPDLHISVNENSINLNTELSKLISGFNTNMDDGMFKEAFPNDSFIIFSSSLKIIFEKSSNTLSRVKANWSKTAKLCFNGLVYHEIDVSKENYLFLINFQSEAYDDILQKINKFITNIVTDYVDAYCTLSKKFHSINEIYDIYIKSLKPLNGYKFYFKDKKLLSYDDLPKNIHKKKFDFKYYSEQIYLLNIETALNYLKEYIKNAIECCTLNEFELKTLYQNALYNIINILDELHFDIEAMNNSKTEYFQRIDETLYADEFLYLLESIELQINDLLKRNILPMNDQIISKIIKYISSHYNEQLSLKEIADMFHFNYYYLSSYFSSHISEGFSDYLNKIRVEKALELLRNRNIPVSEISYLVGYSDHSYFCKVFKKFTKSTPSKFRKNMISSERGTYE